MYNLYSKKSTTQGYDSQNVVQIIQAKCENRESKCNYCGGKIYWNPCVINRNTNKKLPLSQPYTAHGTTPVAHKGCVYNIDNFYNKLVIQDKDSRFMKQSKMKAQNKLFGVDESGLSLVERLIKGRTVEEVDRCNAHMKYQTSNTFDSSSTSGIDPAKMLAGVKVRKK